jgi:hypothetical protein
MVVRLLGMTWTTLNQRHRIRSYFGYVRICRRYAKHAIRGKRSEVNDGQRKTGQDPQDDGAD